VARNGLELALGQKTVKGLSWAMTLDCGGCFGPVAGLGE
jgi:hypothetical protein